MPSKNYKKKGCYAILKIAQLLYTYSKYQNGFTVEDVIRFRNEHPELLKDLKITENVSVISDLNSYCRAGGETIFVKFNKNGVKHYAPGTAFPLVSLFEETDIDDEKIFAEFFDLNTTMKKKLRVDKEEPVPIDLDGDDDLLFDKESEGIDVLGETDIHRDEYLVEIKKLTIKLQTLTDSFDKTIANRDVEIAIVRAKYQETKDQLSTTRQELTQVQRQYITILEERQ